MLLGYDGPLTYAMMNSSPDSSDILGVSRHSINHDIIEGMFINMLSVCRIFQRSNYINV